MSKSNDTPSTPSGDDRNLVANAESPASGDLEEVVQQFWEKNRTLLMGLAAVILVAIIVRNGWSFYHASRTESAREAFAAASDDAGLKAFAADHDGTALAGAAHLKVADSAYADGRYAEAQTAYAAAAEALADTVFADRIALGQAMTTLQQGDSAGGKVALQALANDTDASEAVRGEAVYHLAGLALAAGDTESLATLSAQVNAFAPSSDWAQRVTLMQASAEAAGDASAAAEEASDISVDLP